MPTIISLPDYLAGFFKRHPALKRYAPDKILERAPQGREPEAEQRGDEIWVGPKFWHLPAKTRDFVLAHEIGHFVKSRKSTKALIDMAQTLGIDLWQADQLPYGQYNMEEAFADCFAAYFTNKQELHSRYPAWETLVERYKTASSSDLLAYRVLARYRVKLGATSGIWDNAVKALKAFQVAVKAVKAVAPTSEDTSALRKYAFLPSPLAVTLDDGFSTWVNLAFGANTASQLDILRPKGTQLLKGDDLSVVYAEFIKSLDSYQAEIQVYLDQVGPETFTYNGFKVVDTIHVGNLKRKMVFDAIDFLVALFKRRGAEGLLHDSITRIIINSELGHSGSYTPMSKEVTLSVGECLDPNYCGKLWCNWVQEVMLHEFGHYVGMSLISKEARDFWNQTWAPVTELRRSLEQVSQAEMQRYYGMLEQDKFVPAVTAKRLKGVDKVKFAYWLRHPTMNDPLITPGRFKLTGHGESIFERLRDPLKYVREHCISSLGNNSDEENVQRSVEQAQDVLGLGFASGLAMNKKDVEEIRKADPSIDQALETAYSTLGVPSDYGKTNEKEDFAESFVLFMTAPEKLSENALYRMKHTLWLSGFGGKSVMEHLAKRVLAKYKAKKQVKTEAGDKVTIYEYSDRQIASRNRKKAERLEKLKKNIGRLQTQVKRDLKSKDTDTRLTALAVSLINHVFERPGNESSKQEGHVGVTGWQRKHLTFGKGKCSISYVGKSGVKQNKEVTDAAILKALRDAYDANKKPDLFEHDSGKVTAEKVNAYLEPFSITAKDLRGFHANRLMGEQLSAIRAKGPKLSGDKAAKEKTLKAEFLKCLAATAEAVGHTESILRSSYLVPGLEEQYMKDGTVLGKFDKIAERVLARYAAMRQLDLAWVEKYRKDFLTLMKNLPRVQDYKTAHVLREAIAIYRKNFDEVFFERFLKYDLRYTSDLSEADAKYLDGRLRKIAWGFSIELSLPIGFESDDYYNTEAMCMSRYRESLPKWEARMRRAAQAFWKEMKEVVDWYSTYKHKPGFSVKVPDLERTQLEGFQFVMKGYDDNEPYHREALAIIKEGLHIYRQRASQVLPLLLKNPCVITLDFEAILDKGGSYDRAGQITFWACSVVNKSPKYAAHILAHEHGHHLFHTVLSGGAKKFWDTAIREDFGDLDIQDLLDKWPSGSVWAFEFPEKMGQKDPVLALQVAALSQKASISTRELNTKEDFQKLLDNGTKTLKVPKTPITGYANKNPEEAFCETIGLLVAYGPRAVDPVVRQWLDIVLPGEVRTASSKLARVIPIDKNRIKSLAQDLEELIARKTVGIDGLLGKRILVPGAPFDIRAVDGRTQDIQVRLQAVPSTSKTMVVSGGMGYNSAKQVVVVVNLNAGIAAKQYQETVQKYRGVLAEQLYAVLIHEITHAADTFSEGVGSKMTQSEARGNAAYYNNPGEVRAYLQEIQSELEKIGFFKHIPKMEKLFGPGKAVQVILEQSPTWTEISPYLNEHNRKLVMKTVAQLVEEKRVEFEKTAELTKYDLRSGDHYIERCLICNDVISQCRCFSPNRIQIYGICPKCSGEEVPENQTWCSV